MARPGTTIENLTDQAVLAKIAVEEKWIVIRIAAIGKVSDQVLLRQWGEKDPQAAIRKAVVTRIADDRFLIQRLPTEPSGAVRASIIETLRKKDSLRVVALTAYHRKDREQAFKRLWAVFQDPASDVATAHKAILNRIAAAADDRAMRLAAAQKA